MPTEWPLKALLGSHLGGEVGAKGIKKKIFGQETVSDCEEVSAYMRHKKERK